MTGKAILIADLGFGDAGKGATTDYLVREHGASAVVRYNGGAQCAHNVVCDDGRHHTFAQFGSGTFVPEVKTLLSRFVLVNPLALVREAEHLESLSVAGCMDRLVIDSRALITTPYHIALNRLREMARGRRQHHGTCGMGIGETVSDHLAGRETIFADDLQYPHRLAKKLNRIRAAKIEDMRTLFPQLWAALGSESWADLAAKREMDVLYDDSCVDYCIEQYTAVAKRVRIFDTSTRSLRGDRGDGLAGLLDGPVVFEGAQGVLLDEDYGFHPHTTWSKTTFGNADELLRGTGAETVRIGVTRAYMTRHGAGPFVTEDSTLAVPPGEHNGSYGQQGAFRMGHLDLVMLLYAIDVIGGVDQLAVTCLDHVGKGGAPIKVCTAYEMSGERMATLPVLRLSRHPSLSPSSALEAQEQLGKKLRDAKPVYETVASPDALIEKIEAELGVPVKLVSYGPKASDRRPR